ALVRSAVSVIDFVLHRVEARHDLGTAEGKAGAAEEVAEVLAGIAGPIEQDHYIQEAASRLNVQPGALRRVIRGKRPGVPPPPPPPRSQEVRGNVHDDYLLALLM